MILCMWGVCHSPRRSHGSAWPCEISRQSRADNPGAACFDPRLFKGFLGSEECLAQPLSPVSVFNKTCLQTSHGIHRSCKGTNTFTPSSSIVTLLEEFSRFAVFGVSESLPGAPNFPRVTEQPTWTGCPFEKQIFFLKVFSISPNFIPLSHICVFFELLSSLPLANSILEMPGKKLGGKKTLFV